MSTIDERFENLRRFARWHGTGGGCLALSRGADCECPLCELDALQAEVNTMRELILDHGRRIGDSRYGKTLIDFHQCWLDQERNRSARLERRLASALAERCPNVKSSPDGIRFCDELNSKLFAHFDIGTPTHVPTALAREELEDDGSGKADAA